MENEAMDVNRRVAKALEEISVEVREVRRARAARRPR